MLETIKAHPYLTAGGVIALIVIIYALTHSGGATTVAGAPGTDVEAATGLQSAQLQAASQNNQIQAALTARQGDNASQIELAKIQAQQSGAHDALAAQVATSQISSEAQVSSLVAQLASNIQIHSQDTALANTTVLATNQTEQNRIFVNGLVQQQQISAGVQSQAIAAQQAVATQSWWDKTFG